MKPIAYGLMSTVTLVNDVIRTQIQTYETGTAMAADGHAPRSTWVAHGYLTVLHQRIRWRERLRKVFDS